MNAPQFRELHILLGMIISPGIGEAEGMEGFQRCSGPTLMEVFPLRLPQLRLQECRGAAPSDRLSNDSRPGTSARW